MQKSVLVEIVRSLGKKEQRELHKWLQSPAHNQRDDVPMLFDYLIKNLQQPDSIVIKEDAWKAVFPDKPYDDAYMRQVMYFLLKAVEEYLVFNELMSDKVTYQSTLIRIYRERKLDKAHRQSQRLARENLEQQPLRNSYYLRNRFMLEHETYIYQVGINHNALVNLQETADALETWFLAEKFQLSCEMLAHHSRFQKAVYDNGLLDVSLDYVANKKNLLEPAVSVFYHAYMAFKDPSNEYYFDQLEILVHEYTSKFTHSENRSLFIAALNYCVPKINQHNQDFARRAFELYRKGLSTGVLLENNTVSSTTFGNAVGSALRMNEFGWAEKFIADFKHHLDEKERNSISNFNLARVYASRGEFDKAQTLLTQFDYDDMLFNIIAKTMLLKIYYEQSELDAFESLLESMRIYLQRKEALDASRKTAFKNMISLMKRLLNMNPYSKAQKTKLHELIVATNPLMERDWLLKQVDGR